MEAPSWWSQLLDLIFPRQCVICGGSVAAGERFLCWQCVAHLPFVQFPFCSHCGDPVDGRVDRTFRCYSCAVSEPAFDRARSAVRYRGPVRELLQSFKYGHAAWLAEDLANLLVRCLEAQFSDLDVDVVSAVPLYHARARERGYNQSHLLAVALARQIRKPLIPRLLKRNRRTETQTHLTLEQRKANVKGAFTVRNPEWVPGLRVLLVDDVMTTGATVNECARVLKQAGAARVYVVTVARG